MKIIVLKLDHLGDFIMAIPALRKLRDHFPTDEISLVCGSWNRSIAESCGFFDRVLVYDFFPPTVADRDGVPYQPISTFRLVTNGSYDAAIDLRIDSDTRFLLSYIDAHLKCGIGLNCDFPYLNLALPLKILNHLPLVDKDAWRGFPATDFVSNVLSPTPLYWDLDFSKTDHCAIFGPYTRLPIGIYRVTFHFHAPGFWGLGLLCSIVVDVGQRTVPIATLRLRRRHLRSGCATLEFSNNDENGAIEFRIYARGRPLAGTFRFFGVTIENPSASSGAAVKHRLHSLHRAELTSLMVSLLAERLHPPTGHIGLMATDSFVDPLSEEERGLLRRSGGIYISPLSNSPIKDWPPSNYTRLIKLLLERTERHVVLLGTQNQREALSKIAGAAACDGRLVNLGGKTSWTALPGLFKRSALVICGDSGIAHYAAACGARVLLIFAGTHSPEEWAPRAEERVLTLTADVPCSPCGYSKINECPHQHRCMTAISVDTVLTRATQILGAPYVAPTD
jgi:ADP-heptose:LPS heptosyltransferase